MHGSKNAPAQCGCQTTVVEPVSRATRAARRDQNFVVTPSRRVRGEPGVRLVLLCAEE